ncbi:TonB-dependent receptor [Paraglaciecola aquimarina]|uniref:TonB-dependent receptor n=1 Tax=Paraglaciecola algarum TaxID=3050085 RepID=A0ABS9D4D1_9ALTE|nr:TonB-dependent receptor [Paraglaciecola sp. G1-23]MCF2946883.1 TonB-dependent receptor [Paraglaciecola sp. G1-23]
MFTFKKSVAAIAIAASLGLAMPAIAGNNDGALSGQVLVGNTTPVANATITIVDKNTGFTRTITSDASGSYRFSKLPVGQYQVTVTGDGYETSSVSNISIRIGSNNADIPMVTSGMERIEVTGSNLVVMDVTSSESSLNIGEVELDRIPVPRSVTSVALLAPGTTQGDSRFGPEGSNGNFASFGGASIAENAMYINGLNVTNFRNGVGFSSVPFEFYKEFQVKTGGYSAEFGRSTGGVINAVTKSGSNEFKFGGNLYYSPDSLRKDSPDSLEATGDPFVINNQDKRDNIDGNIYASGAILEDTLFFYAIYNPKSYKGEDVVSRGDGFRDRTQEDSFWGAKIDWHINDDHLLEYLTFSDSNDVVDKNYSYNNATNTKGNLISTATTSSGGDNFSLKYTGYITDDLTVSALYGENKYDIISLADNQADCNMVLDLRDENSLGYDIGCGSLNDYLVEVGEDTREAMRVDIEYVWGDHVIRAGFDSETNTSFGQEKYSGTGDGAYWLLYDGAPGTSLAPGVTVPEGVTEWTRDRVRTVGGEFETEASAIYIEDVWTVNDKLTLQLGLRNETFDNRNSEGKTFVKIDNMIAPRIGFSYDINGDGESKIFANIGRYFLPVANNTNVRLSGNESDVRNYYVLEGMEQLDYKGSSYYYPILGQNFGQTINAAGVVPDTTVIVDQDLDPMYQDEFMVGYQAVFNDNWTWGVRAIRRELAGAIDDMLIDHYTQEKYGCDHIDHNYVLGNPGADMTVNIDTDCDGVGNGVITIPGADLGYPEAQRFYNSVVLTLDRSWDDVWMMSASYTWSHSYGNTEGLVKSDNGQDDAGITTDFDFVELTDGAYGNLANDRRHMVKVFGAYSVTENLSLSASLRIESGRPRNAFGIGYPGQGQLDYGQSYYVCSANCDQGTDAEFTFMPRGSFGSTDWSNTLDLGAAYNMEVAGMDVQLRADIFNVLEGASVRYYEEDVETSLGDQDPTFGLASSWQTPRYVQLSLSFDY